MCQHLPIQMKPGYEVDGIPDLLHPIEGELLLFLLQTNNTANTGPINDTILTKIQINHVLNHVN